jgi:hypothetical protein
LNKGIPLIDDESFKFFFPFFEVAKKFEKTIKKLNKLGDG